VVLQSFSPDTSSGFRANLIATRGQLPCCREESTSLDSLIENARKAVLSRDRTLVPLIKDELRKYITHGELIGRKGKDLVSIPIPQIEIPRFRYGRNKSGGVGQGEGDLGAPLGKAPGEGQNGAGDAPRFNEWSGGITLTTAAGAVNLETADRMRVNIP